MPVLIVEDHGGSTSTEDGTIGIGDLQTMSHDYKKQIILAALPPRHIVGKRNSFYFTRAQILALFDHYESNDDANAIEVALGIHVPETKVSCDDGATEIDNSNCLGVIVSMANKDTLDTFNKVGDYILINGYRSVIEFLPLDQCCPGSKPPPPNN